MFYKVLAILSLLGLIFIFWRRYLLIQKEIDWQNAHNKKDENLNTNDKNNLMNDEESFDEVSDDKDITKSIFNIDVLIKARNFDDAERLLLELLNSSQSPQLYHRLAKIYIEKKIFIKAEEIYEMLTQKYPNAVYFTNLGLCYYVKGDLAKAIFAYENALKIDSRRKERFINLARIYEQMGDKQNARYQYERWVTQEPNDIDGLLVLAFYAEQDRDSTKAKKIYEQILRLSPYHEIANEKMKGMMM